MRRRLEHLRATSFGAHQPQHAVAAAPALQGPACPLFSTVERQVQILVTRAIKHCTFVAKSGKTFPPLLAAQRAAPPISNEPSSAVARSLESSRSEPTGRSVWVTNTNWTGLEYRASGRCGAAPRCGRISAWSYHRRRLTQKPSSVALNAPSPRKPGDRKRFPQNVCLRSKSAFVCGVCRYLGPDRSRQRPSDPSHKRRNSRRQAALSMAI
ncbi:hypothetical protein Mal15_59690 [Stieleria maiorica]|uniref:Uncharacterized protein n=1 Tax=Stieleria maiorica TaxID=2795974 RepID=A0A5B9MS45_9BACT|nr:hypothetical protein Mal15_59690 [Stieleria maiorica]